MTERTYRKALKELGYRLHKHGEKYDLIDLKGNFLVLGDSTIEDIAEHVMQIHFPVPE